MRKAQDRRLVVCVRNKGFAASLELRKVYTLIADAEAEAQNLLRVVDESGEDYLYPEKYFVALEIPTAIARAIAAAS